MQSWTGISLLSSSVRLGFSTAFTMRRLHSQNSKIHKQGRSHDSLRIPLAASVLVDVRMLEILSTRGPPGAREMENESAAPRPLPAVLALAAVPLSCAQSQRIKGSITVF